MLLAEAEAREALQGSQEKMALLRIYEIALRQLAEPAGMGDAVAMAKICTEVEAVHLPSEVSVPKAANGTGTLTLSETIAGLREACAGVVVSKHEEITAAEVIAAAEMALLQVGQWDAFTQREKRLMKDAFAAIAKWNEATDGR